MPNFVHTRETEWYYPAIRDSYGVPLKVVGPGDVLDLTEPPDMFWLPYEGDGTPAPDVQPAQTEEAGAPGSEEN
jgi:hypothetical protein